MGTLQQNCPYFESGTEGPCGPSLRKGDKEQVRRSFQQEQFNARSPPSLRPLSPSQEVLDSPGALVKGVRAEHELTKCQTWLPQPPWWRRRSVR